MRYLKTKMATEWPKEKGWKEKVVCKVLFFIPEANPDYENKMFLVKSWLIEFKKDHDKFLPVREIALDKNENPIFCGPDNRNHGFWCDANMRYEDFEGQPIQQIEFERMWELIS